MTSKMNWTFSACKMASGRRQSIQRNINNPRMQVGGNAIAIPDRIRVCFMQYDPNSGDNSKTGLALING